MKKFFLSVVALTAFSFTAQAQVSIIPKAGLTISNVAFKEEEEGQKSTTGFLVGAGFNFPLSEDGFFSIQPELLYIQKGFGGESTNNGINSKTDNHFNYLELPLLAKISFGSETVKGYVNAGPSIGYALNGKLSSGGISVAYKFGKEPSNYNGSDIYVDANRLDFGLQFGGGVGFQVGPGSLLLDLRYGYGLTHLLKEQTGQQSGDNKSQNRVIAISLGYAIPLGGQ